MEPHISYVQYLLKIIRRQINTDDSSDESEWNEEELLEIVRNPDNWNIDMVRFILRKLNHIIHHETTIDANEKWTENEILELVQDFIKDLDI